MLDSTPHTPSPTRASSVTMLHEGRFEVHPNGPPIPGDALQATRTSDFVALRPGGQSQSASTWPLVRAGSDEVGREAEALGQSRRAPEDARRSLVEAVRKASAELPDANR